MRRIGLVIVLAVSIALAPLVTGAQQAGKVYRIGWLAITPPTSPPVQRQFEIFLQGLRDHGFVEGQSVIIERRYSEGREDRHTAFAAEFVQMKVDLIVANSSAAARGPADLDSALKTIASERPDALWVHLVAFPFRARLLEFAAKNRLATVAQTSSWPQYGALMSYGADPVDLQRRGAAQVARILNGAKPADLPVEQPTKFELVVNLKTAKALGSTIPQSVLVRADEIIQ